MSNNLDSLMFLWHDGEFLWKGALPACELNQVMFPQGPSPQCVFAIYMHGYDPVSPKHNNGETV